MLKEPSFSVVVVALVVVVGDFVVVVVTLVVVVDAVVVASVMLVVVASVVVVVFWLVVVGKVTVALEVDVVDVLGVEPMVGWVGWMVEAGVSVEAELSAGGWVSHVQSDPASPCLHNSSHSSVITSNIKRSV